MIAQMATPASKIAAGSVDIPPAHQQAMQAGWVQWGTDQQQYLMGLFSLASAFAAFDGYSYPTIRTGEAPLLVDDPRADLSVRAWRYSYNARGIIEMPNRLSAAHTAIICVHPWGVDECRNRCHDPVAGPCHTGRRGVVRSEPLVGR